MTEEQKESNRIFREIFKDKKEPKEKDPTEERIKNRIYYMDHKEHHAELCRAWARSHRNKTREYYKKWYYLHREEYLIMKREQKKEYYEKNKEELKEKSRKYYEKNKEKFKEYMKEYYRKKKSLEISSQG